MRDILRDAHINLANPEAIRQGSVEVRPFADDFEAALVKLRELSRSFNGVRPVEVTDTGSGLIRVTSTEAGLRENEPKIVNQAIGDIRARLFDVPATVEREGAYRLRVEVPRHGPEVLDRMKW